MRAENQERDELTILFVCTANVCRSQMAAAVMDLVGQANELPIQIASAGLLSRRHPVDFRVGQRVIRLGGTIQGQMSAQINEPLVSSADIILTMTADHARHVAERFPDARHRVHALRHFVRVTEPRSDGEDLFEWVQTANDNARYDYSAAGSELDIPDPIGQPDRAFDTLLDELLKLTGQLAQQIGSHTPTVGDPLAAGVDDSVGDFTAATADEDTVIIDLREPTKFDAASEDLLTETLFLVLTSRIYKAWDEARIDFVFDGVDSYTAAYSARRDNLEWSVRPAEHATDDAVEAFDELARRALANHEPYCESAVYQAFPDRSYRIEYVTNSVKV